MEKNCENCIHSNKDLLGGVTCRRYPPVITNDSTWGVFPSIENPSVTLCGEWEMNKQDVLFRHVESLHLTHRTINGLRGHKWRGDKDDIGLVGELIQETDSSLMKRKNFGRYCLFDVKEELSSLNLSLGTVLDFSPWNLPYDARRELLKQYFDNW